MKSQFVLSLLGLLTVSYALPTSIDKSSHEIETLSTIVAPAAKAIRTIAKLVAVVPKPASIPGYEYKGCYKDSVGSRTLKGTFHLGGNITTVKCASLCGTTYFGTEYGNECYCSNILPLSAVAVNGTECSSACFGSSSEACGGANRLSIYSKSYTVVVGKPSPAPVVAAPAPSVVAPVPKVVPSLPPLFGVAPGVSQATPKQGTTPAWTRPSPAPNSPAPAAPMTGMSGMSGMHGM